MDDGYEFVEGPTSDLAFVAHGATLGTAFAAAARALLAATVDEPASVRRRMRLPISLEEPDVELLLLRFLNELVYLRDAEQLLAHVEKITVERDDLARLGAELAGERIDRRRHHLGAEVKAATAHGLKLTASPEGWLASVTLDV